MYCKQNVQSSSKHQGTTALLRYLGSHPQMKKSAKNEVHFFDWECFHQNSGAPCKNLESPEAIEEARNRYAEFWKIKEDDADKFTFEKTPNYLYQPYVADAVKTVVPWSKIIFSLRDPVERAYSHFRMSYDTHRMVEEEVTFEDCVDYDLARLAKAGILKNDTFWEVDDEERDRRWLVYKATAPRKKFKEICHEEVARGLYLLQFHSWFKAYSTEEDREKIFVIKSEDLRPDRETNMVDLKAMADFIGIDEMEVVVSEGKMIHEGRIKTPMQDETRLKLQQMYSPFNKRLESLLGDKWKDPWPYESTGEEKAKDRDEQK